MASIIDSLSLRAAQAILGRVPSQKSIWGGGSDGFRSLMGIMHWEDCDAEPNAILFSKQDPITGDWVNQGRAIPADPGRVGVW